MKDIYTFISMIKQLHSILDCRQRKQFGITFFVILLGSFFELLGVSAILPFIQALLTPDEMIKKGYIRTLANIFKLDSSQQIMFLIGVCLILVYIIKNVYLLFSSYYQINYRNHLNQDLSVLMLNSYMNRPYEFFTNTNSGELLRGITTDVDGVCAVVEFIFKLMTESFIVLLLAGYLFMTDVVMTTGVLIIGTVTLVIIVLGVKKNISQMGRRAEEAGADNYKYSSQAIGGIKDILVFNKRDYFINRYRDSYETKRVALTRYQFVGSMPERIIEALCLSGIIATVLFEINMGIDVEFFVPKMAVFAVAAFRLLPSISRITGYIATLIYFRPTLENAYENINSAKSYMSIFEKKVSSSFHSVVQFKNELTIDNISWSYANEKNNILCDLSMKIRSGEAIGIIGESGSGKSTLSDILLQLYSPQKGQILIDGQDVFKYKEVWHQIVSYVPQSVFLLDDTIRKNVAFGVDIIDEERVKISIEKANLSDFVSKLPNGLDTLVGERGVRFSGGQRQRIAIARALYFNPQILVLDEATSALDNETEAAVMDAVQSLQGEITLFIIAHRLTTLTNCDRIYEIKNGFAYEHSPNEIIHKTDF